jgi:hypothetical protein
MPPDRMKKVALGEDEANAAGNRERAALIGRHRRARAPVPVINHGRDELSASTPSVWGALRFSHGF